MDLEKEVISYTYVKEKEELIIYYKDETLKQIENPSKQDVIQVILILLKQAREQSNLVQEKEYLMRLLTVDIEFCTLQELRRKVKELNLLPNSFIMADEEYLSEEIQFNYKDFQMIKNRSFFEL